MADLLDKVVYQDKLLNAGGTKKKATALLAGHGISRPGKPPRHIKKEKGKQKKRCATKDCKYIVRVHFHKFCDDCYSSRNEKSSAENESSALDDVPATVREQNHNRKLMSLKKKMAQMSSNRNKQHSSKPMLSWLTWRMLPVRRIRRRKMKRNTTGERAGPHARQLHCSTLCRLLGTVKLLPVTICTTPMCHLIH